MLNDIEDGRDGVDFVLVFKLSRFGRNAADVLSSLQLMQDYGVNLICVEDEIDSSKEAANCLYLSLMRCLIIFQCCRCLEDQKYRNLIKENREDEENVGL